MRRLLQRVASEAKSSSQRWQAEQALEKGTPGASRPASNAPKPEAGKLFQMPEW